MQPQSLICPACGGIMYPQISSTIDHVGKARSKFDRHRVYRCNLCGKEIPMDAGERKKSAENFR